MRILRQESILDAYQLLLAVLLFASPWLFAFAHRSVIADAWISAVPVAVISCAALLIFREWEEWTNLVLGLWISASPWVLHFQHTTAAHIIFGVGILIGYLAILELWLIHYGRSSENTGHG